VRWGGDIMPGLDVALGIVQGLEQARETMREATVRKADLEQKKQKFDMEMKINKLKLQQVEDQYDPELIALKKKQQKAIHTMVSSQFDEGLVKVKSDNRQAQGDMTNFQGLANQVYNLGGDPQEYGLPRGQSTAVQEDKKLDNSIRAVKAGQMTRDEFLYEHPGREKEVDGLIAYEQERPEREKQSAKEQKKRTFVAQKIEKPGMKRVGGEFTGKFHLIAKMREQYASMNNATKAQVDRIGVDGTYNAILELLKNAETLREAGVDMAMLKDYYEEEINEMIAQGILHE